MADGSNGPSPEEGLTQKDLGIDNSVDKPNRPGGPLKIKPVSINGVDYDPYHPPKLYKNPDGAIEYRGGRSLENSSMVRAKRLGGVLYSRNMVGPGDREYDGLDQMPKMIRRPNGLRYLQFPDGRFLPEPLTEQRVLESHKLTLQKTTPQIRAAYALMMQENRSLLLQVPMELIDTKAAKDFENTGGCFSKPGEEDHTKVELVDGGLDHYQSLMSIRKESAEQVSRILGITPDRITPAILSAFIFAHEMGHTQDYISDYLAPANNKWQEANRKWVEDGQKERANWPLPWQPHITARMIKDGTLKSEINKYVETNNPHNPQYVALLLQRLSRYNLDSPSDQQRLSNDCQKAYKESRSEKAADAFASSFIKGHWQQLGFV